MLKKVKLIIAFMSLSVCLCLMSNTYSRYVAATTGNVDALFAKWQILVNNTDITSSSSSTIEFTPTMEENEYAADNVVAPGSTGYFDIVIDPTNVDVSFSYTIDLAIENENLPDISMTKYTILPTDYEEGDPLEYTDIVENQITSILNFDKETEGFEFETFTIRIFFEWLEGETEEMDDEEDTAVGLAAVTENTTLGMNANITFEQIF